jgi:selenide,water dikinase
MKNLEKRRRVMGRSMRLGHCVCDPRKPCPCPLFEEKDVCLCAGEQLEEAQGPVRLTRLVENAGCASKIDQATLKKVLSNLPFQNDPRVLIGAAAGDDAGVFKLDEERALVQTVDVFSPCVDDPYTFGQIAAANSLSDIYAMGGTPLTALSIVGFPARVVPNAVLQDIFRGGLDKMAEARVSVIGGHSINDPEIKAGFAVTGVMDPRKVVARAGARPGDVMVLTKPIGTGIVAFAAQIDRVPAPALKAAIGSMTTLNKVAAEVMGQFEAHACTDVTGFSLLGHLAEMAHDGGVDVEIVWDDLPLFPNVLELAVEGMISGAAERNRESSGARVVPQKDLPPLVLDICFDAQTSGGLLIAVPEEIAGDFLLRLHKHGIHAAAVIGRVLKKGTGQVHVATRNERKLPIPAKTKELQPMKKSLPQKHSAECCSDGDSAAGGVTPEQKFLEFLKSASAPRALDAHTKQAIALALSVLAKCEPCLRSHIKKAEGMGFSPEEIDEAAWMAIAFGGSPVMMFYRSVREN